MRLFRIPCWVALLGGLLSSPAFAQTVKVTNPWVRSTVAGQTVSGAFMTLKGDKDVALVGASSPLATGLEIHEMVMDGGRMKMRALPRLALRSAEPLQLAPGGHHLMLLGLKGPLQEGSLVPIKLRFEDAQGKRFEIETRASVRSPVAQHHHGAGH